jgi:hypothetical protein
MPYNMRSFLRQAPNTLLARFFAKFEGFADFRWQGMSERRIEGIFEGWQQLPEAERRGVSTVFRQIDSLATTRGTKVLIEAARDRGLDLAQQLGAMASAHARAFACYLDHPEVFESARTLDHIEALPRRSWEKRNGLPKESVEVTEERLADLCDRISEYFYESEGRGELCKVEHIHRASGVDAFYAYPADYAGEILGYDACGELGRQRLNGVFEVVFAYDGSAGTVELYTEGGRPVRDDLSKIFAETVLGRDQMPKPLTPQPYNLGLFKDPNLTFPTQPEHRIERVGLVSLRMRIPGYVGGTIAVDAGGRGSRSSVHDLIQANFSADKSNLAHAVIVEATLRAVFQQAGRRNHSVRFKVSETHCDLGDDEESQLLRGYLKLWGIENAR